MRGCIANFGTRELFNQHIADWLTEHLPHALFTPEQIVAASVPWPTDDVEWLDEGGIYFLQREGRICYVGQTYHFAARLAQHYGRPFDRVTVIAGLPRAALTDFEAPYRTAWDPPWNHAPVYANSRHSDALRGQLAAMPLDLICDRPEIDPLTDDEMRAILAKMESF